MSIYLKAPNATGNVTTQGFKGWIEIYDVDGPSVSANVKMKTGQSVDSQSGVPQFGQISLVKPQDTSSNDFFAAVHTGKVFPEVEFNYVSAGTTPVTYSKLVLKNAVVTHYSQRHNGFATGQPTELITLAYTQVQQTVIPRDATHKPGSPSTTGYDIEKAKKV